MNSLIAVFYLDTPESWIAISGVAIPYLVAVGFVTYWIPRYFLSVSYGLTEDRIVFQGGLWWKRKSFVPYNRITNVDILQGPLSRHFGIAKVSIQTAGYSGQSSGGPRFAELAISGVKDFDEIKDTIMAVVSRYRPMAVEAGVEIANRPLEAEMLDELKKIREAVSQSVKT